MKWILFFLRLESARNLMINILYACVLRHFRFNLFFVVGMNQILFNHTNSQRLVECIGPFKRIYSINLSNVLNLFIIFWIWFEFLFSENSKLDKTHVFCQCFWWIEVQVLYAKWAFSYIFLHVFIRSFNFFRVNSKATVDSRVVNLSRAKG